MYGMYGAIDGVGQKGRNPFIQQPGAKGAENNPFTANKPEDKTNQSPEFGLQMQQDGVGLKGASEAMKSKQLCMTA